MANRRAVQSTSNLFYLHFHSIRIAKSYKMGRGKNHVYDNTISKRTVKGNVAHPAWPENRIWGGSPTYSNAEK